MKGDSLYMKRAVALAAKGMGRTAPNPPVGAVVVKDGVIVGEGFHPRAGQPHAEVFALDAAGERARGATLYVTLEPCSHYGRTPPCTKAVIGAGITRVVVGSMDPNPMVAGSGIRILRENGIKVKVGVARRETGRLIRWYTHWMERKRPFVIAKAAMTLDGRIASPTGDSKWISSEESRAYVHALRNHVDAILVGIGTVLADDPRLTCRLPGGRNPLRVVIDPNFLISDAAQCLGERSIIFTAEDPDARPGVARSGARVVRLARDADGRFSWEEILNHLGSLGLHSVLVEGGGSILSSLIRSRLVDELLIFAAPRILGGGLPLVAFPAPDTIAMAMPLVISEARVIGGDVLIRARLEE
jgi:diaminohydroxyphosphoribosylaminopyrimidine deaminase / 5-amino-6-(5-phosphoribosylamino)uracil reductase